MLDQLLEFEERLVESVVIVKLDGTVKRHRLLGAGRRDERGDEDRSGDEQRDFQGS